MKKLIIVNGAIGVGKTTVCEVLFQTLPKCAFIDGDLCCYTNPALNQSEFEKLYIDNIVYLINNYWMAGIDNVIISNNMSFLVIEHIIAALLKKNRFKCSQFVLCCSKEQLFDRLGLDLISNEYKEHIFDIALNRLLKSKELYRGHNINTDNLTPDQIASYIMRYL